MEEESLTDIIEVLKNRGTEPIFQPSEPVQPLAVTTNTISNAPLQQFGWTPSNKAPSLFPRVNQPNSLAQTGAQLTGAKTTAATTSGISGQNSRPASKTMLGGAVTRSNSKSNTTNTTGVHRNAKSRTEEFDLKEIEQLARRLNGEPRTKTNVSKAIMFGRYYYGKEGKQGDVSCMDDEENKTELMATGTGASNTIRYLRFRPLTLDLSIRPPQPADTGYYYRFMNGEITVIAHLLEDNGFRETNYDNWSLLWSIGPVRSEIYSTLLSYQKVNHFPRSHEITRKDSMHKNISLMQTRHGIGNFNFIPKTFILPGEIDLLKEDSHKNKGAWYISKPAASSQGKGIYVTDDVDVIIQQQESGSKTVVSHYIPDPLLVNGFKFDLRIYVAITSINPLRIYIYEEGLARFASEKYSTNMDAQSNRFVHLTNYAINKGNDKFVQNQDKLVDNIGSKWSITALKEYMRAQRYDVDFLWERIEDLIVKSIISIEDIVYNTHNQQCSYRQSCFELLGYDILVDSKLKPWLLEVNLSPSLACDAPLDLKIKGELLADIFTLVGMVPADQRGYFDMIMQKNYMTNKGKTYNFPTSGAKDRIRNGNDSSTAANLENSKEARMVIKEADEEYIRRGKFKRIYPTKNAHFYKQYFEHDRPFNEILRNHIVGFNANAVPRRAMKQQQQHYKF